MERCLTTESVQGASLSLEGVDYIHSGDSLPLGMLGIGDSITDNVLQENLEDTTSLRLYLQWKSMTFICNESPEIRFMAGGWQALWYPGYYREEPCERYLLAPPRPTYRCEWVSIPTYIYKWVVAPPFPNPLPPLPRPVMLKKEKKRLSFMRLFSTIVAI